MLLLYIFYIILLPTACLNKREKESSRSIVTTQQSAVDHGKMTPSTEHGGYHGVGGCTAHASSESGARISTCYSDARALIQRYLRNLRKRRGNTAQVRREMCRGYREFISCLEPVVKCHPSLKLRHKHRWQTIMQFLNCTCFTQQTVCQRGLTCFEDEYKQDLSKRCDSLYRHNIRQKTRNKCVFLQESTQCKVKLVSTSCGVSAGAFAFDLFKLRDKKLVRNHQCSLKNEIGYNGFGYDTHCSSTFQDGMKKCEAQFFDEEVRLKFVRNNDVVAKGGRASIRNACRTFNQYQQCIRPFAENCAEGKKLLYEFNSKIRTYVLIMDFICSRGVKEEYSKNVGCYQDVVKNRSLEVCSPKFNILKPVLKKISSYQFHCQKNTQKSKLVQKYLDDVRICYNNVFINGCGESAGNLMSKLIRRALNDTSFLGFDFSSNCLLHSASDGDTSSASKSQTLVTRAKVDVLLADDPNRSLTQPNSTLPVVTFTETDKVEIRRSVQSKAPSSFTDFKHTLLCMNMLLYYVVIFRPA